MGDVLLRAENVSMQFPVKGNGWLRGSRETVKAVDGVTLELREGECLGLVGESGCGKSTLGRCLVRLHKATSGRIEIAGRDITALEGEALRLARTDFQMIFQDPFASLDPRMTVFDAIAEPLKAHRHATSREELTEMVKELMQMVGLSPRFAYKYPHEFSGGQRQRIAVARALALKPKVVICDEPVSALDVSVQAQVLNLLKDLQKQLGMAYVFIAHDLAAVRQVSDRIAVMYLGRTVEVAPRDELFANPQHPYTKALLSAIPLPDPVAERSRQRIVLSGDLPSPRRPPSGCTFHTRCPFAGPECRTEAPVLRDIGTAHQVRCLKA